MKRFAILALAGLLAGAFASEVQAIDQVKTTGEIGRASVHIGFFMPMLKGGLLLSLVYYGFFLPMFQRKPAGWYQNPINTAALAVVPVYVLFQFIEGSPTMTNGFDAILVGMACARARGPHVPSRSHAVQKHASSRHPAVQAQAVADSGASGGGSSPTRIR